MLGIDDLLELPSSNQTHGRLTRTWHLEDCFGFFHQVGQPPQIGQNNP